MSSKQVQIIHAEAVNKKKSVSCPAGGRNCGQSGGRNFNFFILCFFHFSLFFFLVGKYCRIFLLLQKWIKKSPVDPFLDWPEHLVE